jgi:hypothetical protein
MYRPGAKNSTAITTQEYVGGDQMLGPASSLPFPTEAIIDATGETVTLLQTCDWRGHSPSSVGVDKWGKLFIGSFQELTVTDSRVLPNELGHTIRARRQPKVKPEKAGRTKTT